MSKYHTPQSDYEPDDWEQPDSAPQLTDRGTMYLIEQRIENLRETFGLSVEELLELHALERTMKLEEDDQAAIPENLGIPSDIEKFVAALEAKRVNRYGDAVYDGGEVDEEDEPSASSVNQYYQNLLRQSRMNLKSIELLSKNKTPLYTTVNSRQRPITLFDFYTTLPKKYEFIEYLAAIWQTTPAKAQTELQKLSDARKYKLNNEWQRYLLDRKLKSPSPFQTILARCHDFVTSPVYDDMKETADEHYRLTNNAEFYFTDKTVVFLIPVAEFLDIPTKSTLSEEIGFVKTAFTLPEYAHERKRYFKKNGSVAELTLYLSYLGVSLSEQQVQALTDLANAGSLRLYHEVLELADHDELSAYFLNIRKSFQEWTKPHLTQRLRERFKQENTIIVRQVRTHSMHYPEWMRKIGGFIIEARSGERMHIPKPLQLGVDKKVPDHAAKKVFCFMPSPRLLTANIPEPEWKAMFVAEMRAAYKTNQHLFENYAKAVQEKQAQLRCSCNDHGTHDPKCPVPLLESIFVKIASVTPHP